MSTVPVRRYTAEEYLALERQSETKHEFYRGEIFAMAGASLPHNRIVSNLLFRARSSLTAGPCEVLPSDMRVKTPRGLYTYPDMVIVCGEADLEDSVKDTLLNPTVLFEVLSPSTEAYDRGKKFEFYREIQSLREFVIVSQDRMLVEHFVREDDLAHWRMAPLCLPHEELQVLDGRCCLTLANVYENVVFAPPATDTESAN